MASSSTSLTCMSSVTCGKDQSQSPLLHSSLSASSSSSSTRLCRNLVRNRRKLSLLSQFCSRDGGFYSSKNFGLNGSSSSFFGSKNVSFNINNRKHPRLNQGAIHSGNFSIFYVYGNIFFYHAKFLGFLCIRDCLFMLCVH